MSDTVIALSDWRDRARFNSLAGLDQIELDWAFASRHPAAQDVLQPETVVRLLRHDPPLRLLTFAHGKDLPATRGLRFRGG